MDLADEFRRLNEDREQRPGRGRRYCPRARRLAVEYCRERRRSGRPFSEVADALGVHVATLGRWLEADAEEASQSPRFHPVALTEPTPSAESPALSVTLPSGLRVEGLELSQVIELAKAWA